MNQIFSTMDDPVMTIVRIVLGGVMFAHGAQKLLGWFGGYGFKGTMGFFTQTLKLPYIVGLLVILIEFFGGIGLVLGLGVRPFAFGVAAVMVGAVVTSHLSNGFFMNWSGAQKGEGIELHLLVLAMCAGLLVRGGGSYALDSWLAGMIS